MVGIACGEPDVSKLSSGVQHTEGETKNLGELFKEAKKKYGKVKSTKPRKKQKEYGKLIKESGIAYVTKNKGLSYKKKYFFKFTYEINGKKATTQRRTLRELYDRVQELGYDFQVINKEQAMAFLNSNCSRNDYQFFCDKLCLTEGVFT